MVLVMAEKVVPMRAQAAVLTYVAGEPVNVTGVCRAAGISRKTFYKYVARVRDEGGVDGFTPRSRAPHSCPQRLGVDVEDAIVTLRKRLVDDGLDHGPTTIQWHLGRDPKWRRCVPSVASVYRVLVRRGFVVAEPFKRPKTSWKRFEAPAPNEMWQIDHTDWVIATGLVKVFNIVDDHSRVVCRSRCVSNATGEEAWTTFMQAGQVWGLPSRLLSDNGLTFSGKLRHVEVEFEARLRDAGIAPSTGRPFHPQTTGKVERFQQTLKKWLRRQDHRYGLAADLAELQARLDRFCDYYNNERPHQGIGRVTPASRWAATPPATPADRPLEHPVYVRTITTTVEPTGAANIGEYRIGIGMRWAGRQATLVLDNTWVSVFVDNELVRFTRIDRTRRYQPTGQARKRPADNPNGLQS